MHPSPIAATFSPDPPSSRVSMRSPGGLPLMVPGPSSLGGLGQGDGELAREPGVVGEERTVREDPPAIRQPSQALQQERGDVAPPDPLGNPVVEGRPEALP